MTDSSTENWGPPAYSCDQLNTGQISKISHKFKYLGGKTRNFLSRLEEPIVITYYHMTHMIVANWRTSARTRSPLGPWRSTRGWVLQDRVVQHPVGVCPQALSGEREWRHEMCRQLRFTVGLIMLTSACLLSRRDTLCRLFSQA